MLKKKDKGLFCTRYAPSPTGHLHIGGARTALFNYLAAKRNGGRFILRIEDTDDERNVKNGHIDLERDLKALNIFPDESFSNPGMRGPYLQSQKLERYSELCNKLLEEDKAYRCFCSDEELEESRKAALKNNSTPVYSKKCRFLTKEKIDELLKKNKPFAIRLKLDMIDKYEWNDLIRGEISIPSDSASDPVIMRSNKKPTYNFAVVIDDYDMEINHVLRGEEHISNTPIQIAIYHALGWKDSIPKFGHLSIIVDDDRKKLSKRSGNELHFVSGLLEKGYHPEAIVNFLVLLGWSYGEEEIFDIEQLIKLFDLSAVSKSPAFFDVEKLNWISHKHFQNMSEITYLNFVNKFFTVDLGEDNNKKNLFAMANKNNLSFAVQLNDLAFEFFKRKEFTEEHESFIKQHSQLIKLALEFFPKANESWNQTTIKNYLKQLMQTSGLKGKNFYKPLRVMFSVEFEGFELPSVIECLGRDRIFENLNKAFSFL